jgi:hypothetical protein
MSGNLYFRPDVAKRQGRRYMIPKLPLPQNVLCGTGVLDWLNPAIDYYKSANERD